MVGGQKILTVKSGRGKRKRGQQLFWSVSWSTAWAQGGRDIGHRCDLDLPLW